MGLKGGGGAFYKQKKKQKVSCTLPVFSGCKKWVWKKVSLLNPLGYNKNTLNSSYGIFYRPEILGTSVRQNTRII